MAKRPADLSADPMSKRNEDGFETPQGGMSPRQLTPGERAEEQLVSATETRMMAMLQRVLSAKLDPVIEKINMIPQMSSDIANLQQRITKLEKERESGGWASSSGRSGAWNAVADAQPTILSETGDSSEVKENPEHHRLVADKLELRYPDSTNMTNPQDVVNKTLAPHGSSLEDMGATIHNIHKGYKSTVVTLKFAGKEGIKASAIRTSARNKFAPQNADGKRASLLSVAEGTVACVIPMALYQKKRNERLFRMRTNIADFCGLVDEKAAEVDLKKRTISVEAKVVARQSITTWEVHTIESVLMALVE